MRANTSDGFGIASVQFDIDGANFGVPVTTPDSGTFSYSASLDVSGLAAEAHQLQATATDIVGNKIRTAGTRLMSAPRRRRSASPFRRGQSAR